MDSDDDDTGGDGGVEEHEDSDDDEEAESESVGESENWSSDEEESESESEINWGGGTVTENLIQRLKANDATLSRVCAYSGDVLQQVCAAVQEENSNITHFSIYGYRGIVIDLNAASVIATALARMPRLSHFSIQGCNNIDFKVVPMLSTFLSNKGSIRMIQWCGSNLGDKEAQVIASCFSGNAEIQEINLTANNIGSDGAIAIASLIESNNNLTSVALSINKIGAEGARKLAQAIVQNQSLEELLLGANYQACADAAVNYFSTALYNDESIETIISRSNHTIKRLDYTFAEWNLIDLHRDGPEKARRAKIIRFLNEQPASLLSTHLEGTLMPSVLDKIGRDCLLNTMFELVRNMPDLFRNLRTQPNRQCQKRSRLS